MKAYVAAFAVMSVGYAITIFLNIPSFAWIIGFASFPIVDAVHKSLGGEEESRKLFKWLGI